MSDIFAELVLGHLIGDYLLQPLWMAVGKSRSSWICALHCLIYTGAVGLMTCSSGSSLWWLVFIFASHYPIDRWNLAEHWLRLIQGRTMADYLKRDEWIGASVADKNIHIVVGGFTAYVYAVTDNALHLIIMYGGYRLLWV